MQEKKLRQTTETITGGRYWPRLEETPYRFVAWVTFMFGAASSMIINEDQVYGEWGFFVLNSVIGGCIVSGALTYVYMFYVTRQTYQPDIVTHEDEYEPTQPTRSISSNHGKIRFRPDIPVTLTHGNVSYIFSKDLLNNMERLYRDRLDTAMQHIARDELGIPSAEFARFVNVLQGVGYLDENKRYTSAGMYWLLVVSYSPTPNEN